MVEATSFPEGFGSDPTIMADGHPLGTHPGDAPATVAPTGNASSSSPSKTAELRPPTAHYTAHYDAALGGELRPPAERVALAAEGFHFGPLQQADEDEDNLPRPSERRSVVLATIFAGLVLAGLGYFLDFH